MTMLFSLGQHPALVAIAAQLLANEKLFAFHGHIYVVCNPDRVGAVHQLIQRELWAPLSDHFAFGEDESVEQIRRTPSEAMQRAAVLVDPEARVWR